MGVCIEQREKKKKKGKSKKRKRKKEKGKRKTEKDEVTITGSEILEISKAKLTYICSYLEKLTAESSSELKKLGPQIPCNNQVDLYAGWG